MSWEFPEIRNDEEFEVFLEGREEPPPLMECTELGEEEVFSEREGERLENHDDSNTAQRQAQKVFE
jgi:hypothetical protein